MSIKKDLEDYEWIMKSIEDLQEQLIIAETISTKMTQSFSVTPKSRNVSADRIGGQVANIVKYKEMLLEKLQMSYEIKNRIENMIESLPLRMQSLMRLKYIDLYSFEEVAVMMNYCTRQVYRIHSDAMKLLNVEE